jgi:plasmid replication initiation protein
VNLRWSVFSEGENVYVAMNGRAVLRVEKDYGDIVKRCSLANMAAEVLDLATRGKDISGMLLTVESAKEAAAAEPATAASPAAESLASSSTQKEPQ